jgi:GMP synthase-like glutamine amidotransferase
MRVLVVANREDPETGYIGDALGAWGAVFEQVWRDDLDATWPEIGAHDLVLTLGSEWSVYWPERAGEVDREARFLRTSVDSGVRVLGICYGAQILAHALGGSVERAPGGGELGWYLVETDVPDQIPAGPYLQWHADRIVAPPGAVELARSSVGLQAFRTGSALGVQFHPETTPDVARRWAEEADEQLQAFGLDADGLVEHGRAVAPGAAARAATIVEAFLAPG